MSAACEQVERHRAAGEALAAPLATHAEGCARCQASEALRAQVARALAQRSDGATATDAAFVARMSTGAEARLERRTRAAWRWPAFAGAAVACAALVVALGVREQRPPAPAPTEAEARPGALVTPSDPVIVSAPARAPAPGKNGDDAAIVGGLAVLSDVDLGLAHGARWDAITASLAACGDLAPGARAPLPHRRSR